jgi:carbamate kinase
MHEIPLDVCGADSQGAIGYALQQNLQNEFKKRGVKKPVATVITQVRVDENDKAWKNPSKPIGGFMDEAEEQPKQSKRKTQTIERSLAPSPGVISRSALTNVKWA